MSAHRLANDLREIVETDSLQIGNINKGEGVIFDRGSSVPTDTTAGYAKGCLYMNTAGANQATMLYVNTGTLASCAFLAVGSL